MLRIYEESSLRIRKEIDDGRYHFYTSLLSPLEGRRQANCQAEGLEMFAFLELRIG